jgi:hypothetical protein
MHPYFVENIFFVRSSHRKAGYHPIPCFFYIYPAYSEGFEGDRACDVSVSAHRGQKCHRMAFLGRAQIDVLSGGDEPKTTSLPPKHHTPSLYANLCE